MFEFEENQLCLIEGKNSGTVCRWPTRFEFRMAPKARGVSVVSWFGLSREHRRQIGETIIDRSGIYRFVDVDGNQYSIRPLTLELYRRHVEPKLPTPLPEINTQTALENHYLHVVP